MPKTLTNFLNTSSNVVGESLLPQKLGGIGALGKLRETSDNQTKHEASDDHAQDGREDFPFRLGDNVAVAYGSPRIGWGERRQSGQHIHPALPTPPPPCPLTPSLAL